MDILATLLGTGGLLWTLAFFILAIGIIVFVHEYGHYIVGRWSGIHAEVFSLGFGPVLFNRIDRRGTRWQIAAIPLGGYVKFKGDSDAASGKDAAAIAGLSANEKRHTMHGAPLWARSATVAAGPIFNFILALVVYWGLILWTGVATERPVIGTVATLPGAAQPLASGDQVLTLNGVETPDLESYLLAARDLPAAASVDYRILRDGTEQMVTAAHPMPPPAPAAPCPRRQVWRPTAPTAVCWLWRAASECSCSTPPPARWCRFRRWLMWRSAKARPR